MKRYHLIIFIILYILVSGYICYKLANGFTSASDSSKADTTQINRRIIQVQRDWDSISKDREKQVTAEDDFDYAVINNEGDVLILTRSDMSKSVSSATTHYDIIRDIQVGDEVVGKIIIHNLNGSVIFQLPFIKQSVLFVAVKNAYNSYVFFYIEVTVRSMGIIILCYICKKLLYKWIIDFYITINFNGIKKGRFKFYCFQVLWICNSWVIRTEFYTDYFFLKVFHEK